MSTTFERLRAVLLKEHRLALERLTLDARLEELGIDSLGTVELLWNVEAEFNIKLPVEPVELLTLADVVRYVDQLVLAQAPVAPRVSSASRA